MSPRSSRARRVRRRLRRLRAWRLQRPDLHTRRGRLQVAGGVVAIAVMLLAVVMGWQLLRAKGDLEAARDDARDLRSALADDASGGEVDAISSSLQGHASAAHGALGGPQWALAEHLPWLGDDVRAVRTLSAGLDDVAGGALNDLVSLYGEISGDAFRPRGGRIDTTVLTRSSARLDRAYASVAGASDQVARIRTGGLLGPLRGPVVQAQDELVGATRALRRAALAARVLPPAVTGTHRYLLLFQNPAEIRAAGGMPGSWAELRVDDGRITLGRQGPAARQVRATSPSELTADEVRYYGENLGRDLRDTSFTPDFPRAAELASNLMRSTTGLRFDGVLGVDAVTLAHLLDATGPVRLLDGTEITSANAVDELLNGIYLRTPDGDRQDAIFAGAVDTLFSRFTGGELDPNRTVSALVRAGEERRLHVWFADAAQQRRIAGTAIAGALPTRTSPPSYGLYLNDATGAKMEYYLDVDARTETMCVTGDAQQYETRLTLHSRAPADAADLPVAVRGPGLGAPPGHMYLNLDVVAPKGGPVPAILEEGTPPLYFRLRVAGRPAARMTIDLAPGQTRTLLLRVRSAPGARGDTSFAITPTVRSGRQTPTLYDPCR